ncbi:TIR domain-containing protein [Pseudomonas akapageensis]|uniref:nSTAND1 domain-containing NTPase n=1 Tax=Pseudomonas akapageensis TaxID=2609961 RepID=UPI001409C2AB|nr:TIR domain-containing protein [Pseudomonas akapageensis]
MSRIFLSHSSVDELEAVALKYWLAQNGWDDVFLDVDPRRGLVAGDRWQDALKRASDRCEVVVIVVSPQWAKSQWCLAEFLMARSYNKRIFCALIKDVALGQLPKEMTAEWQLCRLSGEGASEVITCDYHEQSVDVAFLRDGLQRLHMGLNNAGLRANYFPWPPEGESGRAPYRGLEPLDKADAAVFFGRDVEILQGLDKLRGMRSSGAESLFVILGASGAGKSSFLRAGLLPRLERDDRHFYPLPPIRPERCPVSGARGLAQAIYDANRHLNLRPAELGEVKAGLREGPERFTELLRNIQTALRDRLDDQADDVQPPTLVLSVDQAEELFNVDSRMNPQEADEAHLFLELIGTALRGSPVAAQPSHMPLIVVFTIRSDRYEPLQTAPQLAGLKSVVFDAIKPMPVSQFKEVITGPAKRATANGHKLEVEPDLVNRLLADCGQGGDTLPLLSLTLARLYCDYGGDGDLSLEEYNRMGGMVDVIKNEAESVLSSDVETRQDQLDLLHDAFIPALVTINQENDLPMRRVAAFADLPANSWPLVQALIDKHLLISDQRTEGKVVEVAHESLFRQWDVLVRWLNEEREDLKEVDRLEQAVTAWLNNDKKAAWLIQGERLDIAESLAAKPRYSRRLEGAREFLRVSRLRETQLREEEVRLQEAKVNAEAAARKAAEEKQQVSEAAAVRLKWQAKILLVVALVAAGACIISVHYYNDAARSLKNEQAMRMINEGSGILTGWRRGNDEGALLQLLAAKAAAPHSEVDNALLFAMVTTDNTSKVWDTNHQINALALDPDGNNIVTGNLDGTLQLWEVKTGKKIWSAPKEKQHKERVVSVAFNPKNVSRIVSGSRDKTLRMWDTQNSENSELMWTKEKVSVTTLAFNQDGSRIVSGSTDGTLQQWDAETGEPIGDPLKGHKGMVTSVAFSKDGRIVSGGADWTLLLWDAKTGKPVFEPLKGHQGTVATVAFNKDGSRIVSGSRDWTIRLWDATTGKPVGEPLKGHEGPVTKVVFKSDDIHIVSGSRDQTVREWDVNTGNPMGPPIRGHNSEFLAFNQEGNRIVSGSLDQSLQVWSAHTGASIGEVIMRDYSVVLSVAFRPDRILSLSTDSTLRQWAAKKNKEEILSILQGDDGEVSSVAFSGNGSLIVSGSKDGMLRLWSAETGKPITQQWRGHDGEVTSVAFNPDGSRIVSGSTDSTLRLWNAENGKSILPPLRGHNGEVTSVAFDNDGSRIVSGSKDGMLRLWNAETGEPILQPLQGQSGEVSSVAFSRDGARVASGSKDGMLMLWDASTGRSIRKAFKGHEDRISSLDFSQDHKFIVSGSADRTLQLWDAENGTPIGRPLQGHEGRVNSVAFSEDSNYIASGSSDGTVRRWPTPTIWPDWLCAKLTRNLSHKEWNDGVQKDIRYETQCKKLPISSPGRDEEK